jgi:hypothetical protein
MQGDPQKRVGGFIRLLARGFAFIGVNGQTDDPSIAGVSRMLHWHHVKAESGTAVIARRPDGAGD